MKHGTEKMRMKKPKFFLLYKNYINVLSISIYGFYNFFKKFSFYPSQYLLLSTEQKNRVKKHGRS